MHARQLLLAARPDGARWNLRRGLFLQRRQLAAQPCGPSIWRHLAQGLLRARRLWGGHSVPCRPLQSVRRQHFHRRMRSLRLRLLLQLDGPGSAHWPMSRGLHVPTGRRHGRRGPCACRRICRGWQRQLHPVLARQLPVVPCTGRLRAVATRLCGAHLWNRYSRGLCARVLLPAQHDVADELPVPSRSLLQRDGPCRRHGLLAVPRRLFLRRARAQRTHRAVRWRLVLQPRLRFANAGAVR